MSLGRFVLDSRLFLTLAFLYNFAGCPIHVRCLMLRSDEGDSKQMEDLDEVLNRSEKLLPELRSYVFDVDRDRMVGHPLLHGMSVTRRPSPLNSRANAQFVQKQQMLAEAQAKNDYVHCIWLHERPYRLSAMLQYQDELTDDQWQTLRDLWVESENIGSTATCGLVCYVRIALAKPV
jgi:hypothetical protein